jgi:hypothetical protein
MSDVSSGSRAPDVPYPPAGEPGYAPAEPGPYTDAGFIGDGDDQPVAKQVAGQGAHAAGQAVGEVRDTAMEQAQRVGAEARTQARNVASDVRGRVAEQARAQNDRLVGSIRQTADQLDEMRGDRADSPAASVVSRVADGGRQLADYLDRSGPEGVLREVRDFARRRPGAFLATALAAGFVVGRLGKGVAQADPGAGPDKPGSDSFVSSAPNSTYPDSTYPDSAYPDSGSTGYAPGPGVSTEYAATGTGTPVVRDYPGGIR